jgi:hypothetical protein
MSAWRVSLEENVPSKASAGVPTPAASVLPRNPIPSGTQATGAANSNVDLPEALNRLTQAMSNKLELWQRHSEKLSRELIREVTTVIHQSNSATTAPPLERIPERVLKPFPVPRSVEVATQPQGTGPTNKRVYAVVKGRSLRIFDTWRAVLTSVSGYPNAKYKSFRHQKTAQEWYLEQLQVLGIIPTDQNISEDEAGDEDTVDYNSHGAPMGTNVPSRKAAPSQLPPDIYPAVRQNKNADLVDFQMAGPDPSTGDGTKIHAVSINISSDVRDLLCLKGMTQEMQSRMLEVTPNVLTYQGKSSFVKPGSEFEIESMWNRFAGAMSGMADVQALKLGSQGRDTQWNLPSRNSLAKVKSFEDAMEFAEELISNRNSVLDNAKSNYLEILFAAHHKQDGDTWVPSYPIWAPPRCAIYYFLHSGMVAHT